MLTFIIPTYYFCKLYRTEVISIPLKVSDYLFHFILPSGQDVLSHPNELDATPQ